MIFCSVSGAVKDAENFVDWWERRIHIQIRTFNSEPFNYFTQHLEDDYVDSRVTLSIFTLVDFISSPIVGVVLLPDSSH
jgi:hypothetical protein